MDTKVIGLFKERYSGKTHKAKPIVFANLARAFSYLRTLKRLESDTSFEYLLIDFSIVIHSGTSEIKIAWSK